MTILPPDNIDYGIVTGRFIYDIVDGDDVGTEPDFKAMTGTVTFTASVGKMLDPGAVPVPVIIGRVPIVAVLDEQGYLCTPLPGTTTPAYRWVELIATDDEDLNPVGWVWNVVYDVKAAGKTLRGFDAHTLAVPSGTSQDLVNFIKPDDAQAIGIPQATALAAQAAADALAAAASAAAAEAAVIDSAEFVGSEIATTGTPAEVAVAEKIADEVFPGGLADIDRALVRGSSGKRFRFLAFALRNYGSPNYWQPITEPGHLPVGITSVTTDGGKITLNYDFSSSEVGTLIAATDETMSKLGFRMGCSVGLSSADLYLSRKTPDLCDMVYYDGTNWLSQNNIFTIGTFAAGVLTLTHPNVGRSSGNVQVSSRGGSRRAVLAAASPPIDMTSVKVEFYDNAGTLVTTPDTGMRALVLRSGFDGPVDPRTAIDSTSQPLHNIWVYGIHEIA